jgi:hypothetical protein
MKKIFITILFILLFSCEQKPEYDHYSLKDYAGNKQMEYWLRENIEYKAVYDEKNKITNFFLSDGNLTLIVTLEQSRIQSYSIEDKNYKNVVNLDNEGNIINAKESMPLGYFEYIKQGDDIIIKH